MAESLSAAQLTEISPPVRPLAAWIRRTSNSLPVPVSPVTRIGESTCPARAAARMTANIAASAVNSGGEKSEGLRDHAARRGP